MGRGEPTEILKHGKSYFARYKTRCVIHQLVTNSYKTTLRIHRKPKQRMIWFDDEDVINNEKKKKKQVSNASHGVFFYFFIYGFEQPKSYAHHVTPRYHTRLPVNAQKSLSLSPSCLANDCRRVAVMSHTVRCGEDKRLRHSPHRVAHGTIKIITIIRSSPTDCAVVVVVVVGRSRVIFSWHRLPRTRRRYETPRDSCESVDRRPVVVRSIVTSSAAERTVFWPTIRKGRRNVRPNRSEDLLRCDVTRSRRVLSPTFARRRRIEQTAKTFENSPLSPK